MQLDSHGNIVNFTKVSKLGKFKLTKTQRKQWRKDNKAYTPEGDAKPPRPKDTQAVKGYEKRMKFLSRGCDITAA